MKYLKLSDTPIATFNDLMDSNDNAIFVYGANLKGVPSQGAHKLAWSNFKAEVGVGEGPTGRAYALPMTDLKFKQLKLLHLEFYCRRFVRFAEEHPELLFLVAPVDGPFKITGSPFPTQS
jgi:hypothetical protein